MKAFLAEALLVSSTPRIKRRHKRLATQAEGDASSAKPPRHVLLTKNTSIGRAHSSPFTISGACRNIPDDITSKYIRVNN